MRFAQAILFVTLVVAVCFSSVSAITCKCMKSRASITRQVCEALHYKIGTDDKYVSEFGHTTCYNLGSGDPAKYFYPKCTELGGTSYKCY